MAFIRTKTYKIKGVKYTYHYLVEGVRDGDKVRQGVIGYLGTHNNVRDAYKAAVAESRSARTKAAKAEAQRQAKTLKPYIDIKKRRRK